MTIEKPSIIDERPLLDGLREASNVEWSGLLRVNNDNEQVGAIVMRQGRIAWAVYQKQKEALGEFLYRIGKLTREQLKEVTQLYFSLGKTKKLGSILEAEGLIDRPTLRKCLLLHIRSALLSMITKREFTVITSGGELVVEEDLTFSFAEIFSPQENNADIDAKVYIFDELANVPGYSSTLIAGPDGQVLVIHGARSSDNEALQCANIPLKWLQSTQQFGLDANLGAADFAFFEFESSTLVVRWIGSARKFIAVLCLERTGKIGMAKYRLNLVAPALEEYIQNLNGNDQQMENNE